MQGPCDLTARDYTGAQRLVHVCPSTLQHTDEFVFLVDDAQLHAATSSSSSDLGDAEPIEWCAVSQSSGALLGMHGSMPPSPIPSPPIHTH